MELLLMFNFEEWKKSSPLSKYYVRLQVDEKCWIMQSSKREYLSNYKDVKRSVTGDIESIENVDALDGGGSVFEKGVEISFVDGTEMVISIPDYFG